MPAVDSKLTALDEATSLVDAGQFYSVQGGLDKRVSGATLANFVVGSANIRAALAAAASPAAANPFAVVNRFPINVRDYGALGDGITDDAAAIQAALDAAYAAGRSVYVPEGTFLIGTLQYGDYFLRLRGDVVISGTGDLSILKVKNAAPDYTAIFVYAQANGNILIRDLAIDQNATNNQRIPGTSKSRMAFSLQGNTSTYAFANNLLIDNMTVRDGNGVWVVLGDLWNSVVLRNCHFVNLNNNVTVAADTSAIYLTASRIEVAGCEFQTSATIRPYTAIETHGGLQAIHDNRVDGFKFAGNLTAIAPNPAQSDGIAATGNVVRNCQCGFTIWNGDYPATSPTPRPLKNISIVGNTFKLSNAPFSSGFPSGIRLEHATLDWSVGSIDLSHNLIEVLETNLTSGTAHDGLIVIYSGTAPMRIDRLTIAHNTLINAVSHAIQIWMSRATDDIRFIKISDNLIIDPMQIGASIGSGLDEGVLLWVTGGLVHADVMHNTIVETRGSVLMQKGFWLAADSGDILALENNVEWAATPTSGYKIPYAFLDEVSGTLTTIVHRSDLSTLPAAGAAFMYGRIGSIIYDLATVDYLLKAANTGTVWMRAKNVRLISDNVALLDQSSNIGSTNFPSAGTAGTYRIQYYLECTTLNAGATSVQLTVAFTDDAGATTVVSAALPLTALGRTSGVFAVRLASGFVSYAINRTDGSGLARYAILMTCERIT